MDGRALASYTPRIANGHSNSCPRLVYKIVIEVMITTISMDLKLSTSVNQSNLSLYVLLLEISIFDIPTHLRISQVIPCGNKVKLIDFSILTSK